MPPLFPSVFFFNDTATTEIYTLSLHDALPIFRDCPQLGPSLTRIEFWPTTISRRSDRKSTRLNSSHQIISYAVFCLKKKKKQITKVPQHRPETAQVHCTVFAEASDVERYAGGV